MVSFVAFDLHKRIKALRDGLTWQSCGPVQGKIDGFGSIADGSGAARVMRKKPSLSQPQRRLLRQRWRSTAC
jgi:hypothetical protein